MMIAFDMRLEMQSEIRVFLLRSRTGVLTFYLFLKCIW